MIREAIDLYKQLENHEKVGDLYKQINCIEEANESYEKVINSYKNSSKYVKASLIYKYKMNNKQAGQTLLLDGWKKNRDAYNCLINYIENFDDLKQRKEAIQKIYEKDVSDLNSNIFLQAIKLEFNKNNEISEYIKTIAYEIIVSLLPKNKNIIKELNNFNKADKLLSTDILHFKIKNI